MKKKGLISLGIIIGLIVIISVYAVGVYNNLVSLQEGVRTNWSQVENQYQRRTDLIPNLVNAVKGYMTHERETLQGVIEARSQATAAPKIEDPTTMTPEQLAAYQQSQNSLGQALGRLMVVVERYPELKADQQFLQLQSQLEGTENRITVARMDFNESAREYNINVRRFPATIFAKIFGFHPQALFQAEQGAEKAPEVQF